MGICAACVRVLLRSRRKGGRFNHCFNIALTLVQSIYFVLMMCHLAVWRAGEAWPRSEHTGSLLPDMLRGKSPCLWAESATGRPEDLGIGADSETFVELWFWVLVLCISKVMP